VVADIDGNAYRTVKIGDQWWMAENLRVSRYRNGDPIVVVRTDSSWPDSDEGVCCVYEYRSADKDWKDMEIYLGMEPGEASTTGIRGTDEGGKLKETGVLYWFSPNKGASNESGFSARPGGGRFDGNFTRKGELAIFWTIDIYQQKPSLLP
jgi:uncharacterized protein (TIGR02145 family)